MSWKKPKRDNLMIKVIQLARLPRESPDSKTITYLSRRQLESLVVYLEHVDEKLRETSSSLDTLIRQSEKYARENGQVEVGTSESKDI